MVLLSRDRVSASPELIVRTISPKAQNKSLKHSTTPIERHVPPITPMLSIQNAQKNAEALNGTAKTAPKTA